ncbi:substrate-binding periplasmic protein [Pelagibacterium luteolum]|uniref:Polar amino acid transport system substrate-binding protein n=1 Tax=Pelagibacterium luteolum TaxID=440168 RepID=A0A1G7XYI2_9HYPH|nr:transporter substrate-binding domain-containing protein [Pelagibacterium luteolum]SDG89163.1 polar amino acid transport system substrate-binding protein [Pelagibacterium luteolum]
MLFRSPLNPLHKTGRASVRIALVITSLIWMSLPSPAAIGQEDPVSRDMYDERLRNEGNSIAFCLRPIGPLASFEAELADQLGQVLLTEVRTYTVNERSFPVRPTIFDYIFGLTDEQMFIVMAEQCDVLLGMHLSTAAPPWVRLSRPYIVARMLGISDDPEVRTLADLRQTHRIGVQALAAGDAALTSYLRTLPADTIPQRVIFRDNRSLFEALSTEQVDVTLMWEGALMAGVDGDATGYHALDSLPFPVDAVRISAAVNVRDSFLGALIDEAIAALEADGTLAEMAVRHKILWPDA